MKRTPLQRKTALRRVGKKTSEWDSLRAKLKVRFERAGITTCEVRLPNCWRDNGLGFLHRLKRRNVTTPGELERVALGCNRCHDALEILPEMEMARRIDTIIDARETQP